MNGPGCAAAMAMHTDAETGNEDELEAMRAMFGADFAMLAELYLSDSPKRIAILHAAAEAGDADQAAKVVHTLSGSCASIGATRLAMLCQAVELDCRQNILANLALQLQAIETEYAKIDAKLRAMLRTQE